MKKTVSYIVFVGITLLLILNPQVSIVYAKKGLDLCSEIIIPSLFPFFVCSGLLIYSGFCEVISKVLGRFMRPLFNINPTGAAAFVLGLISGYPLGAVTACNLYEGMYISKTEAERLLAFCNNSGPLFVMSAVGVSLYHSTKAGVLLYLAHILGCVSVGLVFRFYKKDNFNAPQYRINTNEQNISDIFSQSLVNSVNSILIVCAAVVFCSVISNMLLDILPINTVADAMMSSLMEFVSGLSKISYLDISLKYKLILSAWVCAFAGISVHLQVMGVTAKSGLSLKPYISGKILHAFFSALYTFLLLKVVPVSQTVFSDLSGERRLSGGFFASSIFTVATVLFILLVLVFSIIFDFVKLKKTTAR